MNKSPSNLRSAWLQAWVVDSESKPQWLKVKASKVTKQSVQCIIYKELKKKKTLEAKMQIQLRLKRTERERARHRRRRRRWRCDLKSDSLTVGGWSWRLEASTMAINLWAVSSKKKKEKKTSNGLTGENVFKTWRFIAALTVHWLFKPITRLKERL